ncbi:MAG: hypothetical protein UR81_C0013G0011 [Candidatus Levybacteria bacterium GW2011_GWB1_35_5]|nr:MAG: hypothetical protein UR81_C0013G0011 [Candidatus Levybacteria bacterium GW2011_GWB1_35_5]
MQIIGYDKPLYILPFDHRAIFATELFGYSFVKELNEVERHQIKEFKMLIYKGFKKALEKGIPTEYGAILCDEEFGEEVLIDARQNGFLTILTTEKSGEQEFKFQYPDSFEDHIEKIHPNFTKVLIKYNPVDSKESKDSQKKNLKILSDYSHDKGFKFLLEVLVIPTSDQLLEVTGREEFDTKLRSNLTVEVILDLQDFGIEPDVWKLEGFETKEDFAKVIEVIKREKREKVGLVILGRGAKEEKVEEWLKIGSRAPGVIGFAVGRTVFWDVIERFYRQKAGKAEVIETVANNFYHFFEVFTKKEVI